jgi:hypothetical protein
MISVSAQNVPSVAVSTLNGRFERSTPLAHVSTNVVPKRAACSSNTFISSGPRTPFGKPG